MFKARDYIDCCLASLGRQGLTEEELEVLFIDDCSPDNIYEYARERNHVNMRKLLRYASRRNRKEKVEHIIYTIDHDQSQE